MFAILAVTIIIVLLLANRKKPRGRLRLSIVLQTKGADNMLNGNLPQTWSVLITAAFEDPTGKVQPLAGTPAWESSDETIATVAPAADGLSATITGIGPGTAKITVTAEADPVPGKNTLTAEADITVLAPEDTQVVLTLGTP